MKKRVISSIVIVAIFIPLTILGGIPFLVFCTILGFIALREMYSLEKDIPNLLKIIGYFILTYLMINNYHDLGIPNWLDCQTFIIIFLIYSIPIIFISDLKKYDYKKSMFLIFSTLLIGLLFKNFIYIRNIDIHTMLYIYILSTVTDTFAYLTGIKLGEHKLCPNISPNKTIEGSIGGSLFGTLTATLFYLNFVNGNVDIFLLIIVSFLLTVFGQIGDLFFSSIKRTYEKKDFGEIIPGHGGILDRLDSILFIMVGYMLIVLII